MEKDIDKIAKNPDTDIVIRIDDYGGKKGVTIREFIRGERYTGFTKNGTRIPAERFEQFRTAINSIDLADLAGETKSENSQQKNSYDKNQQSKFSKQPKEDIEEEEY